MNSIRGMRSRVDVVINRSRVDVIIKYQPRLRKKDKKKVVYANYEIGSFLKIENALCKDSSSAGTYFEDIFFG